MSGKFKKQLSLLDLTFIGLGAIFGSGWLFAASHVSAIAGPAGILSWFLGGFAVLLLGIVYCELGAALPRAGGVVRYPVYSHGPLLGYLMGFITLIAFSSLIAIEVVASRQYAAAWFPGLTKAGSSDPTVLGWLVQFALLGLFFFLNYRSVKTFAKANNLVSVFKFIVPLLVIGVLFTFFKPENFEVQGFAPFGLSGVEMAVSAGGIIFAYLGLTPIISVASEVKNPQRTIPIALILSVLLSTAIYALLQLAFLGSVPTEMLANGWASVTKELALPYRDIALALGVGWLAYLVVADAVISPSGCGNIYMNATPRVIYGWAQTGTFFKYFTRIDAESGIPRPALWLTFGLSVFWTLPFPSWEALINVVSAALVLSYAVAPVSVAALRRNAPHAAPVPGQGHDCARPAVVHHRCADRVLVGLEHRVVAAGPADRDVRAVPAVQPFRTHPAPVAGSASSLVGLADRLLRADHPAVVAGQLRRPGRHRPPIRHRGRGGLCTGHLLLGRRHGCACPPGAPGRRRRKRSLR